MRNEAYNFRFKLTRYLLMSKSRTPELTGLEESHQALHLADEKGGDSAQVE
jgi:hypothetical protein